MRVESEMGSEVEGGNGEWVIEMWILFVCVIERDLEWIVKVKGLEDR